MTRPASISRRPGPPRELVHFSIERAMTSLRTTGRDITDIATDLCDDDRNYFSRQFRVTMHARSRAGSAGGRQAARETIGKMPWIPTASKGAAGAVFAHLLRLTALPALTSQRCDSSPSQMARTE